MTSIESVDLNKREVQLKAGNKILSLEAYVGGYFGTSYEVLIDLENKVAIYNTVEEGLQVGDDKEISIDDATFEKFCSDMDSVGILNWEKEYVAPMLDGTSWSVRIKMMDGVFESSGSNAFPKNWERFCDSVEDVVKGEFR